MPPEWRTPQYGVADQQDRLGSALGRRLLGCQGLGAAQGDRGGGEARQRQAGCGASAGTGNNENYG